MVVGVIENMKADQSSVKEQIKTFNIPFLGEIDFDPKIEDAIGNARKLLETDFAKSVNKIFAARRYD